MGQRVVLGDSGGRLMLGLELGFRERVRVMINARVRVRV